MAALAALPAAPALADELIGSYRAYIGEDDLYNSSGERLRQPWQVLRQDRANFHKFGIAQRGDEDDDFFASAENRANMEYMVQHGSIARSAAKALVRGGVMVTVEIYGNGDEGDFVNVTVGN
nr:hypothetical protein [Gellertiella hungarica]